MTEEEIFNEVLVLSRRLLAITCSTLLKRCVPLNCYRTSGLHLHLPAAFGKRAIAGGGPFKLGGYRNEALQGAQTDSRHFEFHVLPLTIRVAGSSFKFYLLFD